MFRRCISLLVIAGMIAGQLAAVPHAHDGVASISERREHDATPHFHAGFWHLGWFGYADHEHGHDHSHAGHGHHSVLNAPSDNPDGMSIVCGLDGAGHDADAIYLPEWTGIPSTLKNEALFNWHLAAPIALPGGPCHLQDNPSASVPWHPPDEVLDASDSYLTLRTLRI